MMNIIPTSKPSPRIKVKKKTLDGEGFKRQLLKYLAEGGRHLGCQCKKLLIDRVGILSITIYSIG